MLSPYNFLFPSSQWGMGACSGPKWPPMAPPEHPEKAHFFKKKRKILQNIFGKGEFFQRVNYSPINCGHFATSRDPVSFSI